jgi:hypothetical protein
MRKTSTIPPSVRRFLAESAIERGHLLAVPDRAALFETLAELLEGEAADAANLVAFSIRENERAQLKLANILQEARQE